MENNKIGNEILLLKGLPKLPFGTTRSEVEKLLGKPDDIDRYSDEDNYGAESWHYDELGISLVMEELEDWRITTITVSNEEFTLFGRPMIGIGKEDLGRLLADMNLGEMVEEDWSDSDTEDFSMFGFPDQYINLWLIDGELSEIQWGVKYDDNDEAIWPE